MAVPVVELLEEVEVEHEQCQVATVAVDLGDLVVEIVDEGAVVVQAGEPVRERRRGQVALRVAGPALHAAEQQAGDEEERGAEERLAHHLRRGRRCEAVVEDEEVAEPHRDGEAAEFEEEHGCEDEREEEERPEIPRPGDGDRGRDAGQGRHERHASPEGESSAVAVARDMRRLGHAAPSQPCLASPTTSARPFLPLDAPEPVVQCRLQAVAGQHRGVRQRQRGRGAVAGQREPGFG